LERLKQLRPSAVVVQNSILRHKNIEYGNFKKFSKIKILKNYFCLIMSERKVFANKKNILAFNILI